MLNYTCFVKDKAQNSKLPKLIISLLSENKFIIILKAGKEMKMKKVFLFVFSIIFIVSGFTLGNDEPITEVRLNSNSFAADSRQPSYCSSSTDLHMWLNVIDGGG